MSNIFHAELEAAFSEKTKAILVNSPHNPTGKVFSREDLQFIADLCQKWNVYAILDEVSCLTDTVNYSFCVESMIHSAQLGYPLLDPMFEKESNVLENDIASIFVSMETRALQVYEHLVFKGSKHVSLRSLPGMRERCIRIGSAGKTFSLTAWKVGTAGRGSL